MMVIRDLVKRMEETAKEFVRLPRGENDGRNVSLTKGLSTQRGAKESYWH